MIIRVSAKISKKIHFTPQLSLPADSNPFADWSTHLFTADRTQYILITNSASLYSMVMYGRDITTDFQFLDQITDYMGEFIRDDGHRFIFERLIAPSMDTISFSKALNRAVTGSMNDLIMQAKIYLANRPLSPHDVSLRLNDAPMSYLDYDRPKRAFRSLKIDA